VLVGVLPSKQLCPLTCPTRRDGFLEHGWRPVRGAGLNQEADRVWVVQLDLNSRPIPVAHEEAAEVFRRIGWHVTEVPLGAI